MLTKDIDLYEYYNIRRNGATGGILTAYIRSESKEVKRRVRPAMLILPGGGYSFVSDREAEPVALKYLGAGFCSFVLNYSVKTKYPAPLIEAMLAAAYIRDNAESFCVDRSKVCAIGFSAGGHLAGLLATLSKKEAELVKMPLNKVRLNAVIFAYADASFTDYYHEGTRREITGGDETLCKQLSVERRINKDAPPAFIWHTYTDGCVPVENALMLANEYRAAGVPFSLHIFENGRHGLSTADEETCDDSAGNVYLNNVSKWFALSLDWLKSRDIEVQISNDI